MQLLKVLNCLLKVLQLPKIHLKIKKQQKFKIKKLKVRIINLQVKVKQQKQLKLQKLLHIDQAMTMLCHLLIRLMQKMTRRNQRELKVLNGKGRRKKVKSGNSSSITGCFAIWLNSKFRKNGGGNNDGNSNTSTKTTPEPLIDGGGESTSR
uniref:Candidate secreted effector n=1 Tax=Meloidogyne incognita TaxID=6306 RepID=A0A914MCH2_MELIC